MSWVNRTTLPGARLRDKHTHTHTHTCLEGSTAELLQHTAHPKPCISSCSDPGAPRRGGETPSPKENKKIHPGSCKWSAEPRNLGLLKIHFPKIGLRKASSMAHMST